MTRARGNDRPVVLIAQRLVGIGNVLRLRPGHALVETDRVKSLSIVPVPDQMQRVAVGEQNAVVHRVDLPAGGHHHAVGPCGSAIRAAADHQIHGRPVSAIAALVADDDGALIGTDDAGHAIDLIAALLIFFQIDLFH